MGDLLALDAAEYLLGVVCRADDERSSRGHRRRKPAVTAVVLKGALDKHDRRSARADAAVHHFSEQLPHILPVRAHDALGYARTAAGELDARECVLVREELRLAVGGCGAKLIELGLKALVVSEADLRERRIELRVRDLVGKLRREYQAHTVAQLDEKPYLSCYQAEVERDGDGADLLKGVVDENYLAAIGKEIRDLVAAFYPEREQRVGNAVYARVCLGVAYALILIYDRRPLGRLSHRKQKRLANIFVKHQNTFLF